MQIQSFWTINSAYLNGACVTKMAERALAPWSRLPRTVASPSQSRFSLSLNHVGITKLL